MNMSILTLDDFTSPSTPYVTTLQAQAPPDTNFQPLLPSGGPLGQWRETVFINGGPNSWAQPSTLYIGNGILIVNSGFDAFGSVQVQYGYTPPPAGSSNPQAAPLGLNLSNYSAFQLAFAGVSTSESLNVSITVFSAGLGWECPMGPLNPSTNAFTTAFQFSTFVRHGVGTGLPPSVVSDIDRINIFVFGGGFVSFGITSIQALPPASPPVGPDSCANILVALSGVIQAFGAVPSKVALAWEERLLSCLQQGKITQAEYDTGLMLIQHPARPSP
jgi:hypothetical protein